MRAAMMKLAELLVAFHTMLYKSMNGLPTSDLSLCRPIYPTVGPSVCLTFDFRYRSGKEGHPPCTYGLVNHTDES